ncbi:MULTISPECIES: dihydrofolate reductase family protein [Haloferax]|uniref:Deaminase n=1 Tax=Haloferax marinum TaxID=2666143 RepID=A0A6A8G5Z2_9EURY|nr:MULTISPECIES: RibD family protein [Haloferax]KAB1197132.1 RibD family protein [Haloferax sp. CBA1150]MRW96165.1 deaminase [Haloferax marinum]
MAHVVVHNAVSLDGRIEGFPADIGTFYELAATWNADVHLVGSETLLANEDAPPADDPDALDPFEVQNEGCPLLVVPDSRGRIRNWRGLLESPFWSRGVALVSHSTPEDYRTYLEQVGIEAIEAGADRVNLQTALETLESEFGSETILVDSGGTLSGILLRGGLVNEVSVLVHPRLVGGESARTFCRGPDPAAGLEPQAVELRRQSVESLHDGLVWLRYDVGTP